MTSSRAILEAVVQRALLGTQRASAAAAVPSGDLQSLISRIDASNAERALLSSAAIVSSYELAGRLPTSSSNASTIAPAALEADDRPEASAGVARFLTTMLGGVNDEVLREWLTVVAARGWRVPTPMLPVLLDVGQGATYLRELIIGVLGQRGRWLAARNEQWGWAALPMQSDDTTIRKSWETGTPAERAALLRDVRARAAGMGRELVESTWKEDTPAQRAEFVEILGAVGPTIADEAFLEAALDDRRQEVRRAAADVLSHMAASALVARMTARAIASLGWKQHKLRKDELTVEPPKELDDAAERDGVARKAPTGIGERAWWLAQIIACVPPAVWSERWRAAPEAIVAAAASGDWSKPLVEGFAAASVSHDDPAWAEAILRGGYPHDKPTPLAPKLDALLRVLDVRQREALVAKSLRDAPQSDETIALVAAADHMWTEQFADDALRWLRKRIAGKETHWHLRELIPRLALRVPARLAAATEQWPTGDDAHGYDRALDRFISILTYRRELAVELDR